MPTKIGVRLTLIREERGVLRQELADEVGVHYETIRKIERSEETKGGIESPGALLLFNIAQALDVDINYFFAGEAPQVTKVEVEATQPSELRVRFPAGVILSKYELRDLEERFATEFDIIRKRQERGRNELLEENSD